MDTSTVLFSQKKRGQIAFYMRCRIIPKKITEFCGRNEEFSLRFFPWEREHQFVALVFDLHNFGCYTRMHCACANTKVLPIYHV